MSDVLHRPGFLTRLRKGARSFFSRLFLCVRRRPKLIDTSEAGTHFTSSLPSLSDISMTSEEDLLGDLNQSAIAHSEDFIPRDFDQYERTSFEDLSSIHTDPWEDLFDEPSYYDDGNQNEEDPPRIPIIVTDIYMQGKSRMHQAAQIIVYFVNGHVTMSVRLGLH
ncbi:uncharacterized protein LOC106880409 isoform X1 [Octopus bimaculoides]|uniref:Uncharacterized protein n=1 Tax=Octopus bimaculoides TaxID=37653 RepID=A0A0L8FY68_OCTBM|nr:uncharacterized protein LOC106880409 isoform X1 [Octopus bimaculoides]|eukprot:XP_014785810.1 PREDICTED: uncharacterized protein LOC106880409 isoform X1 [Octopus bimaculoides]